MGYTSILIQIASEAQRVDAGEYGRPYASAHEFYGVLIEEVQELFDEIKKKKQDKEAMKKEAVQVASVCLRFINQLNDTND